MTDLIARGARTMAVRTKIALGIAFVEGLIVWIGHDLSRWAVFGIAVPLIVLYFAWGRTARAKLVRDVTWIAAASQALALILLVLAVILSWLALALAVLIAVVALLFLFADRGGGRADPPA